MTGITVAGFVTGGLGAGKQVEIASQEIIVSATNSQDIASIVGSKDKPNIVFIMLDDLGFSQIEAYSRGLSEDDCDPALLKCVAEDGAYTPDQAFEMVKKSTPTLSRMVDEGVRFNNAFACSNLCAPSRIGVATGILQNRWGIYRNIDTEEHGLKPNSHLAERFKEVGYATAHIGKWHIGSRDDDMVNRYLEKHGVEDVEGLNYWNLGKKYPKIQKELRVNGWQGSVVPKDHPLNNGFDYYFGYNMWESPFYNAYNVWENFSPAGCVKGYNTDVFTKKAQTFIEQSLAENKPFYVQLHYHAVHSPLEPKAPAKYYNRFDSGVHKLDNFYAHVFGVDENIRLLGEFLKEKGEYQNTLFIFTSDNGGTPGGPSSLPGNAPYSGHKGMMNMGGFRVPLFFYWPSKISKPLVKDQLVSTLDIIPTALDAAGIEVPENIDGKSLLPQILEDSEAPVRSHFTVAGIHSRMWAFHSKSLLFDKHKARELEPAGYTVVDDRYILRYVAEAPSGLYKDARGGVDAYYALYDYINDPLEQNNIIGEFPERAQQMKEIWKRDSRNFPSPAAWGIDKWESIINAE
ncbi:MAG TPA: sulfatase-like hydrolase/transferase [Pontiella sp.]